MLGAYSSSQPKPTDTAIALVATMFIGATFHGTSIDQAPKILFDAVNEWIGKYTA